MTPKQKKLPPEIEDEFAARTKDHVRMITAYLLHTFPKFKYPDGWLFSGYVTTVQSGRVVVTFTWEDNTYDLFFPVRYMDQSLWEVDEFHRTVTFDIATDSVKPPQVSLVSK